MSEYVFQLTTNVFVSLHPQDIVTKVTVQMLQTSEDWKYEGCTCNSKLYRTEDNKLQCKKCPGEITSTEPKYHSHYFCSLHFNFLYAVILAYNIPFHTNTFSGIKFITRCLIPLMNVQLYSLTKLQMNCLESQLEIWKRNLKE